MCSACACRLPRVRSQAAAPQTPGATDGGDPLSRGRKLAAQNLCRESVSDLRITAHIEDDVTGLEAMFRGKAVGVDVGHHPLGALPATCPAGGEHQTRAFGTSLPVGLEILAYPSHAHRALSAVRRA